MEKLSTLIIHEINNFAENYFNDRKHAVCLYGSVACDASTDKSDIDLFIATDEVSKKDSDSIRNYIVDLHQRLGITLDDEVPFENKLVVTYEDVEMATSLHGLEQNDGKIFIPPIQKNPEFLGSYEVRLRLLFNALTTPNVVIGNDAERLSILKEKAEYNLLLLALNNIHRLYFSVQDLIESLLSGKEGEEGEMYLGYKRKMQVVSHLNNLVYKKLSLLLEEDLVIDDGHLLCLRVDKLETKIRRLGNQSKY